MIKNYLKIAYRNLVKNKAHSIINITGLSVGMAVAMLIGLWIWDELSFNTQYVNYSHIARVMQNQTNNGEVQTMPNEPVPLGNELRSNYGSDFKYVSLATGSGSKTLAYGDIKLNRTGPFVEPDMLNMLGIQMLAGSRQGLAEPNSILLSASLAKTYFGNADPLNKVLKINNQLNVKITGVYSDLPANSTFADVTYILPWQLYVNSNPWMKGLENEWGRSIFYVYAQIADNADMGKVSAKIKDIKLLKASKDEATHKPELFLHPMSKWHLYTEFKNGVNTGGSISYVWLFGIIGVFVLLLACINFMNLSTARSEKRAKEIGIRKAVGSLRGQLIIQFFVESLLFSIVSFLVALFLVQLSLPYFNNLAGKEMVILFDSPVFWLLGIAFSIFTGILAGSYPALYLSSFNPVKVLKGPFKAGNLAAIPRKALIVLQFTASIILIIGTIVVFRQIQFAKDRPIGYNQNGLVALPMQTDDIHKQIAAFKDELLKTGAITNITEGTPTTDVYTSAGGLDWKGKDPNLAVVFPNISVSFDYGKTIGWQIKNGRDFSRQFKTDSTGFIVNEAAVKYMGLKNPVGETITWNGSPFHIIGVVNDIVMESPYQAVQPSIFHLSKDAGDVVMVKINQGVSASVALSKIENIYKKYNPSQPFEYRFVDDIYSQKYGSEKRIGQLAGSFAMLAIFISCLGLFGMAQFMAGQRTKEIGIRKILGASVTSIWRLLSIDFMVLIILALLIATPMAYYFMHQWLQGYLYHAEITWWIFAATGLGAIVITLLTVSFESIKAAIENPVKGLKAE